MITAITIRNQCSKLLRRCRPKSTKQLKEELGLDHFEGRKWIGCHRHVTLTMVAFAFLLLKRIRGQKRGFN